jgi:sugar O-acyltransferase (sialic acid O-acetyltransferase NeuD family)
MIEPGTRGETAVPLVTVARTIGLLGNGAQAREIESFLLPGTPVFRAVSESYVEPGLIDIARPSSEQRATAVVASVGSPGLRRHLVKLWPGSAFATLVAPSAVVDSSVLLGGGTVVAPGAVLSVGVRTGDHCLVNVAATLAHDVILGDFVSISPGAHLGGRVHIGDGAFIGIGAIVSDGVQLAPGSVVGAGAVVIANVDQPNTVIVGNPARPIRVNQDWLDEI